MLPSHPIRFMFAFMTAPFGSLKLISKRVAELPTMVLFETRGL